VRTQPAVSGDFIFCRIGRISLDVLFPQPFFVRRLVVLFASGSVSAVLPHPNPPAVLCTDDRFFFFARAGFLLGLHPSLPPYLAFPDGPAGAHDTPLPSRPTLRQFSKVPPAYSILPIAIIEVTPCPDSPIADPPAGRLYFQLPHYSTPCREEVGTPVTVPMLIFLSGFLFCLSVWFLMSVRNFSFLISTNDYHLYTLS